MKKAIFFDWDGTLSVDGVHISQENCEALRKVQEKGHLTFLCTARSYGWVAPESKKLNFDGLICGTGSHIMIGNETIFCTHIEKNLLRELVAHFLKEKEWCLLEGEDAMFTIHFEENVKCQGIRLHTMDDFDRLAADHPITKITLTGEMTEETRALLSPHFTLLFYEGYQEALLPGCSKASGMEKVLKYYHMSQKDSVGIGDSPHDFDMLEYADLSIVMGNAPEEVKKKADKVSCRAEEHGVAEALNQWVLNI